MQAKIIHIKDGRDKPVDVAPGCDSSMDDMAPYADPPLDEYVKSAGYPDMTDERVKTAIQTSA